MHYGYLPVGMLFPAHDVPTYYYHSVVIKGIQNYSLKPAVLPVPIREVAHNLRQAQHKVVLSEVLAYLRHVEISQRLRVHDRDKYTFVSHVCDVELLQVQFGLELRLVERTSLVRDVEFQCVPL